jgi:hypothetical protein
MCGLDSTGSWYIQVAGYFEHGEAYSDYMEGGEFFEKLSEYKLFNMEFTHGIN